jgi:hypothetical protein
LKDATGEVVSNSIADDARLGFLDRHVPAVSRRNEDQLALVEQPLTVSR